MLGKGKTSVTLNDILNQLNERDILSHYFGISQIPTIINSPLRKDNKPSFGFYSMDGDRIFYTDLATKEKGGLFDLLGKMWGLDFKGVLTKINEDIKTNNITVIKSKKCNVKTQSFYNSESEMLCKVREWKDYDIKYWRSYGIELDWLKYAEVYPISHKIIKKVGITYTYGADKYAYAYVERKEGKVTLKIYQPFNKDGYKWANKHDSSVISLWTKIPEKGDKLCICSSLKDALCLWSNTGIPCINPQGEGYNLSNTAISELKKRYKQIYILYDNDEAGINNSKILAEHTKFTNVILPKINNCKDISDLYKSLNNKEKFKEIILKLFN